MVSELENSPYSIAYSTAFETPIIVDSKSPYKYRITDRKVVFKGKYNKLRIMTKNITPIQSVMFEKEVFKKCGGFDESIDALEDWDMWIRFALKYDWKYIEKTTSIYRVPAVKEISEERTEFLNSTLDYVLEKYKNIELKTNNKEIFDLLNER